jgi:hypothetical protein
MSAPARRVLALCLLGIAGLTSASTASGKITLAAEPPYRDARFPGYGLISIRGSERDNRLHVFSHDRITAVHGDERVESRTPRYCHVDRPRRGHCRRIARHGHVRGGPGADLIVMHGDHLPKFIVDGGEGPDHVIDGAASTTIRGGGANDLLEGGRGDDRILGDWYSRDPGADRMLGGPGDDALGGSSDHNGLDVYRGGGGDDLLLAANDSRQAVIDGGSGYDRCQIDQRDPKPLHCEHVVVRDR